MKPATGDVLWEQPGPKDGREFSCPKRELDQIDKSSKAGTLGRIGTRILWVPGTSQLISDSGPSRQQDDCA